MLDHARGRLAAQGVLRIMPAPLPAPKSPKLNAGLRAEWRRMARVLADPNIELTTETVSPVLALHGRLVAAGVKLDTMADALLRQMAYQLVTAETCH